MQTETGLPVTILHRAHEHNGVAFRLVRAERPMPLVSITTSIFAPDERGRFHAYAYPLTARGEIYGHAYAATGKTEKEAAANAAQRAAHDRIIRAEGPSMEAARARFDRLTEFYA